MDSQNTPSQLSDRARRKRRDKLIFLAIIAVAVTAIYISQYLGSELPDWPGDLDAALAQARKEDKKVLVFLAGSPPSETARTMSKTTLYKNNGKISKLPRVLIKCNKNDPIAKRFNVKKLPTFLMLNAEGKVLNRRVGFIAQAEFPPFLECRNPTP